MTDRIVLTIPSDARLRAVGTLVLGGVGSRADLPYERMDDLQLALVSALGAARDGEVTLEIDADAASLRVALGPLQDGSGADPALTRVLTPLVDAVELEQREGGEWISLALLPRTA